MKNTIWISFGISLLTIVACKTANLANDFLTDNIDYAATQYERQIEELEKSDKIRIPRTVKPNGEIQYAPIGWDWTAGFYAGSLWYLYNLTGNEYWQSQAKKYTEILEKMQYNTQHHDIGFIIGCSYLNGIRMGRGEKEKYKSVVTQTAKSLSTRFRPAAGVIQSWNIEKGWQSQRGWKCPVIIDNMMNLEILFEATRLSGDSTFYNIAISHANQTLKNHFRNDGSSFHVVDYDPETGEIRTRCTAQGYADESAWARGQAWAIYGYTMCYRYTHDSEYLKMAEKIYEFIFTHPNMPEDLVPYWDYDAVNIPNEPRDVSAAAITASALYELSTVTQKKSYKETADLIMASLASPNYRAKLGENHCFLLMHSVGSIPHGSEIDVPLNYADYYFLESLKRKRDLDNKQSQ